MIVDTRSEREPRRGNARRAPEEGRRDQDEASHTGIVKVIEVLAESEVSWEDAVVRAVEQAGASLHGIQSIYVKDQQAIVREGRIAAYRLNAKISFVIEPREQGSQGARSRHEEPRDRGEHNMPNRDYDDYGRNEGRFDGREDQGSFRDQSNRSSRDWERRGEDFRRDRTPDYYGTQGYGEQRRFGGDQDRDYGQRSIGQSGRSWYDERRDAQRLSGQQDWSRDRDISSRGQDWGHSANYGGQGSYDYGRGTQSGYGQGSYGQGSQSYGQGSYGQGSQSYGQGSRDYGQGGAYGLGYGQSWGSQGSSFGSGDYGRSQSNYGGREGSYSSYGRDYGGQGFRGGDYGGQGWNERGRDDESWGQQIRQGAQQVAQRVKRAFRGPKGYKRSDERIREDVSDRLAQLDELDPSDIEVQVQSGEVTLTGTVQNRREKFLAEEIADDISGVSDVHNQLRVRREEIGQTSSTTQSTTTSATGTTGTSTEARGRNAGTLGRS